MIDTSPIISFYQLAIGFYLTIVLAALIVKITVIYEGKKKKTCERAATHHTSQKKKNIYKHYTTNRKEA